MDQRLESLLRQLDHRQRACVLEPPGPLVIEAGPGSGKTRVLATRAAYRVAAGTAEATRTLVVTFTRRAAGELRVRLRRADVAGVRVGTIHAVAYELVERYRADRGLPALRVAAAPHRLLAQATEAWTELDHHQLARQLDWAAACGLTPEQLGETRAGDGGRGRPADRRAGPYPELDPDLVAEAYRRYQALKRRRGVLDLGDLLQEAAGYLQDPGFAAATSWWFRHVLVDEAQDLNAAQWRLILAIAGRDDDLCLIGDPDQAIYGWNGASAGFLTDFEAEFPHATRQRLDHNYRCPPALVTVARQLLDRGGVGAPNGSRAEADPALSDDPPVRIIDCPDDRAEADDVARLIGAALVDGVGASRLAVLSRTNAGLEPIAAALRRSGIPYETGRPLLSDPTVRQALRRLERSPLQLRGGACRRELAEILDELDPPATGGRPDAEDGATKSVPAEELLELAAEWAEGHPSGRPDELLQWLNATTRGHGGIGSATSGVQLLTFHRAKGLEWRRVFLVGLAEDQVPLPDVAEPDEERRLLYVALTRAEEEVTCSWPARRLGGPGDSGRAGGPLRPSPLLEAVRPLLQRAPEHEEGHTDIGARLRALQEELLARRRLPDATRPFTAPATRTA